MEWRADLQQNCAARARGPGQLDRAIHRAGVSGDHHLVRRVQIRGAHPLTAVYLGDSNFNTSTSSTVNETVNAPGTTASTLTTSTNPISTTQSLTLTATVTPPAPAGPTGQVQFKDGPTVIGTSPLSGGTATLTISNLTAGTHPLTAVYLGDSSFNTSTSNTVSEMVNPPGTTTLTSSPNPSTAGQAVTLTASPVPGGSSTVT